ncbi:MAG: ABC transporter ATP-binding protein [Taibaiella sp.]|nr:ABC transporter ATP-binding protein [Taibaiella sp.]
MKIELQQVSKRYIRDWVFKNVSATFEGAGVYALLGSNGSGKSTLLRLIAGMQQISSGRINYEIGGKPTGADTLFQSVGFCAPAMDVIEEMTLSEFLHFHFNFKKILPGWTVDKIIAALEMEKVRDKFIHDFSSGMKQRAKLAQAFFSDTPFLLLDEPCSNLDLKGVAMYQGWLQELGKGRLVVVASNDEREYPGALQTISLIDYK